MSRTHYPRRSGEAVAAQMRRAGTMKHRNVPRGGARNEFLEFLEEAEQAELDAYPSYRDED